MFEPHPQPPPGSVVNARSSTTIWPRPWPVPPYRLPKAKIVFDVYSPPGRSSIEGKLDWFGESG